MYRPIKRAESKSSNELATLSGRATHSHILPARVVMNRACEFFFCRMVVLLVFIDRARIERSYARIPYESPLRPFLWTQTQLVPDTSAHCQTRASVPSTESQDSANRARPHIRVACLLTYEGATLLHGKDKRSLLIVLGLLRAYCVILLFIGA